MTDSKQHALARRHLSGSICVWCAIAALLGLSLMASTGCDDEAALLAFRDAAATDMETGFKTIMDGIIGGIFAAVQSGDGSESPSASSTSASSSG